MVGTRNDSNRLAVVRIVLVEGRNLPRILSRQPNIYCSLQLGKQKEKSSNVTENYHPVWKDTFEFYLYGGLHEELQVTIKNQTPVSFKEGFTNDEIGKVNIDLASLKHETTTDMWKDLDGNRSGKLHLLVTISGTGSATSSNLQNIRNWEALKTSLDNQINRTRSYFTDDYVGKLLVTVHRAEGLPAVEYLGGKSDPFCVIKVGDEVLRTETLYKRVAPSWNKYFEFSIKDVCDCMEITIFDEENDKKHRFLGRIKVPLLRIRNNERTWYSLKDNTLRAQARGDDPKILLEFFFVYNKSMLQFNVIC